jgi:hypothetical protein
MPPEGKSDEPKHWEVMRAKYGEGLNEAQADAVYGAAYHFGHGYGEHEVEVFYQDLAELARSVLDKDER